MASSIHPGPKPRNAYGRLKHKEDLRRFARDLNEAVNACLPSYDKPYGQVAVLALHWENDDLNVAGLETELLAVFRRTYGFNVESYTIPTTQSTTALTMKLGQFAAKWDLKDSLSIYIYSGHAEEADQAGTHFMLGGAVNYNGRIIGPRVNWFHMQGIPEDSKGDVLFILDSCFTASAALYDGPEMLAAASWGDVAGAQLDTSFTRMLIDELKSLDGSPCSIAHIYASIHRNAIVNNLGRGPVHIAKKGKESIILAKIYGPKQRKPESFEVRRQRIDRLPSSENRVLISIHLQDNITVPDLEQWKNWLTTNIPSRLLSTDITIEAIFHGASSVALITLPLEVWTMLPINEEAYSFISFVNSNNILPQLDPPAGSPLAIRPAMRGRETQPPPQQSLFAPGRTENQPVRQQGLSPSRIENQPARQQGLGPSRAGNRPPPQQSRFGRSRPEEEKRSGSFQ